ncbi:helix-turn-helix domain-containing protein [Novosphingobium cyanobacteriorum]|uniref:Helix-turn-helix domain-containing protein n=1 Tax=Novosphingobium cyanobacteriorum TaxID=3024215 RepID=A0ABT6CD20_9SPHN|nr:helix-turn-helix domain-containing protein [Novosphingobium cyanobacteriorum]MDF8331822.1 helix-turn-helix domain-containing protein [Novosphingobium cyanobacteriorum]
MTAVRKFDTEGIAPPERLRYWNELVDRIYGGTFVRAQDNQFQGAMLAWSLGDLDMIRPRSTASFVGRQAALGSDERLILHLQCRGESLHRQGRFESRLEAGDFVIGSSHESYSLDLTAHQLLVVEFPRAPLEERLPGVNDLLSRRMSGASAGGRVFRDFLLSLWQNAEQATDSEWCEGVNAVFYDMVALAMRGAQKPHEAIGDTGLRNRVLALVDAHLADPDLKTLTLAQACNTSIRTVQNVFAAMGTTPSAYILEQRLSRAADRLVAAPDSSITDVAFELGFNDSGYFTRCFRQRFGAAPRDWRSGR